MTKRKVKGREISTSALEWILEGGTLLFIAESSVLIKEPVIFVSYAELG